MHRVFVPCWGSLFQNAPLDSMKWVLKKFSSPAGVLYFKIHIQLAVHAQVAGFSSPAGVLYFKIQSGGLDRRSPGDRFRPLLGFFISKCSRGQRSFDLFLFSSPAGVLYFKILSSTPTEFRGVSDHFAAQIAK